MAHDTGRDNGRRVVMTRRSSRATTRAPDPKRLPTLGPFTATSFPPGKTDNEKNTTTRVRDRAVRYRKTVSGGGVHRGEWWWTTHGPWRDARGVMKHTRRPDVTDWGLHYTVKFPSCKETRVRKE